VNHGGIRNPLHNRKGAGRKLSTYRCARRISTRHQIKGIGESPLTPVAPAIANAVADAVGVRIRDLPITAEKVYRALQDKAQS
jgi:hypothetical protein